AVPRLDRHHVVLADVEVRLRQRDAGAEDSRPALARVLRIAGHELLALRDVVELHLDLAVGQILSILFFCSALTNAPDDEKRIGKRFLVMTIFPLNTSSGLAAALGRALASSTKASKVPNRSANRLCIKKLPAPAGATFKQGAILGEESAE